MSSWLARPTRCAFGAALAVLAFKLRARLDKLKAAQGQVALSRSQT